MNEQNVSYSYELNGDKSVRITGYKGDAVLLTVPAELDGHKVADIGMFAFNGCENLQHVVLSEGIVTLYVNAFWNCPNLESIRLPDSVENSVHNSVRHCPNFKGYRISETNTEFYLRDDVLFQSEIDQLCDYPAAKTDAAYIIPESTKAIASGVFAEHAHLQEITLPEGLTAINDATFRDCQTLECVHLPQSLQTIGAQAFAGCGMLERIQLPASVNAIGQNAFSSCWSLYEIECDPENAHFTVEDGVLYDKAKKTLLRFPIDGRTGFVIPEGVKTIAAGAFSGCGDLYELRLPQSLRVIEGSAFTHCGMLTGIEIPEGVSEIHPATFLGCTSLQYVGLPASVKTIGQNAFWYCLSLKELEVAADAVIDEAAFGGEPEVLAELNVDCYTRIVRK